MPDESIKPPSTFDNSVIPEINYFDNSRIRVRFDGHSLSQGTVNQDFTPGVSLFGAVKLTGNSDLDRYKYSGYGIGFDPSGCFSLPDGSRFGKNVTILGSYMSSSVRIMRRKKFFILGKDRTKVLDNSTSNAEK